MVKVSVIGQVKLGLGPELLDNHLRCCLLDGRERHSLESIYG